MDLMKSRKSSWFSPSRFSSASWNERLGSAPLQVPGRTPCQIAGVTRQALRRLTEHSVGINEAANS
jgi:hypothetical protein